MKDLFQDGQFDSGFDPSWLKDDSPIGPAGKGTKKGKGSKSDSAYRSGSTSSHSSYSLAPKCYMSHPELKVLNGTLIGGSCSTPKAKDADIYIGLDAFMTLRPNFPWHSEADGPVEVLFRITDGCAPSDAKEFKAMVDWVIEQLEAGKRVHIGCIGGHGRTGTLLSAIICKSMGEKDAIQWVRDHYCKKVVETASQVDFLHKHFGITKRAGSRGDFKTHSKSASQSNLWAGGSTGGAIVPYQPAREKALNITPINTVKSIWGKG